MSLVYPLNPHPGPNSYFPQTSRSPGTNHGRLPQNGGPSRYRPRADPGEALQNGWSRSAPTSPSGRNHPSGLSPLSTITPLVLSPMASARPVTIQQTRPPPKSPRSQPVQSKSLPSTIHMPPPLVNPAARMTLPPSKALPNRLRRPSESVSSSSETETGFDSDSTFVPYRSRSKKSLSQPDLTALRSRLEGWAGGVARGQQEERLEDMRRKTPPARPIPLVTQSAPLVASGSKSHSSLIGLRQPSPRGSPGFLAPMTPLTPATPLLSSSSDGSSPRAFHVRPSGGVTGSEDADDDYEGTDSPSSGSLSFSPKRSRSLRHRGGGDRSKGSLGLTLGPDLATAKTTAYVDDDRQNRERSNLLGLRLLAIVPSVWGIWALTEGLRLGLLKEDNWPWGVDFSREAWERKIADEDPLPGPEVKVVRGDMVLAIAWALCTAHFCFSLTTGLTHRWRSYYSFPSVLTRLVSLQCLCWPATYLTLWFLGAERPLLAWVVIGVTTGWSRTVQLWVTSNVVPGERTPKAKPTRRLSWYEHFTWGRRWDWDVIARKVGWKIGSLLLVTLAWTFWKIEVGLLVQVT